MGILHSLFGQQINWGRIVAMMSFLRALCEVLDATTPSLGYSPPIETAQADDEEPDALNFGGSTRLRAEEPVAKTCDQRKMAALQYLVWTVEFIHKESQLAEWIEAHGSWVGLGTAEAVLEDIEKIW